MQLDKVERRLAAILHADVQGYSRLIAEDEPATLRLLSSHLELMQALVRQHGGRAVGSRGDSLLAEFPSVVEAVQCAVEMQRELKLRNATVSPDRKVEFRMGINVGEVVVEGEQIHGAGINVAVRIEGLAPAGGICISEVVYDQIKSRLALACEDLGERQLKNIAKPVRVYRVLLEEAIAILQRALLRSPHVRLTHSVLAIIYSELGREEEARAAAAEVLRLNPHFSLEVWRQSIPAKNQAVLERDLAALRKAGLK